MTDSLLFSDSWPGITLALYPGGAGKIHLVARYTTVKEEAVLKRKAALETLLSHLAGKEGRSTGVRVVLRRHVEGGVQGIFKQDVAPALIRWLETVLAEPERNWPDSAKGEAFDIFREVLDLSLLDPAALAGFQRLEACLVIERSPRPDATQVKPEGESREKTIQTEHPLPFTIAESGADPLLPPSFEEVARQFEHCLLPEWNMVLAFRQTSEHGEEFWLVSLRGAPQSLSLRQKPAFWTTRPWRTTLGSGVFEIPEVEEEGKTRQIAVKDVDYDVLERTALAFLQDLSTGEAGRGFPEFKDLREERERLAEVLTDIRGENPFMVPLRREEPAWADVEDAHEAFREAVRLDLRAFHRIDTLVQFAFDLAAPASIGAFRGRLEWQIEDDRVEEPLTGGCAFYVANPAACAETEGKPAFLTFGYEVSPGLEYDQCSLERLGAWIEGIRLKNEGKEGGWLHLARPVRVLLDTGPGLVIPAITRTFPRSPSITACTLAPAFPQAGSARDLLAMRPELKVDLEAAGLDRVRIALHFNPEETASSMGGSKTEEASQGGADLEALLVLNVLAEHAASAGGDGKLGRVVALAAAACRSLNDHLAQASLGASFAPGASEESEDVERIEFLSYSDEPQCPGYNVTVKKDGEGTIRAGVVRENPVYLTAFEQNKARWALRASISVVRNEELKGGIRLNPALAYAAPAVFSKRVWADLDGGMGFSDEGRGRIEERLESFLHAFFGSESRLDFEMEMTASHAVPLGGGMDMRTRFPLLQFPLPQGALFEHQECAKRIAGLLEPIQKQKPAGETHWLELEINLWRHSAGPDSEGQGLRRRIFCGGVSFSF